MTNPNSGGEFPAKHYSQILENPGKSEPGFTPVERKNEGLGKQTDRAIVPVLSAPLGKRLLPLKEAAKYLGRSEWSMRGLIWARKIPVVREARKIYLDIHDLDEYINRNKALYN